MIRTEVISPGAFDSEHTSYIMFPDHLLNSYRRLYLTNRDSKRLTSGMEQLNIRYSFYLITTEKPHAT